MMPTRSTFQGKIHTQIKSEEMERYFIQTEMIRKWELQLIYNKTDFKTKAIKKDNKGHYIIIK